MDGLMLGPPPVNQSGFDLQADQSYIIIATSITLITLGTSFVILRLTSRWLAHAGYWWDDILVSIALLLAIIPSILNICGTTSGGLGRHVWAVESKSPEALSNALKILFVFQIFFSLSTATIKLCTLTFYLRIFPAVVKPLKLILFGMAATTIAYLIISIAVTVCQCMPIHKFWDLQQPGTCWSVDNVLYGLGAVNTTLDFLIVSLPVPLLWRLRTSLKQKMLLTGTFLMASFVCVVSLMRLLLWSDMNTPDITWNSVPVILWSATEPIAGIICACIPSLRPLFTVTWDAIAGTSAQSPKISSPPGTPSSRASHMRQTSLFSIESPTKKAFRPSSGDLEEIEKIARGGRPWGNNATAYGGFEDVEEGMEDVVVPKGHIAVKTDWSVSICSNEWQYMDRVY